MFRLREREQLRILDFDIENRPLSYLGMDFTTAEITAIACGWVGQKKVHSWFLTPDDPLSSVKMLTGFLGFYNEADIVTGHYVRRHDLPIINGALMEHGLPLLGPKLVSDTKVDMKKKQGVSASQESLADMLDVHERKFHMTQALWRSANRLTPEGIAGAKRRVVGDIKQHKKLRVAMIDAGWLGPPTIWKP